MFEHTLAGSVPTERSFRLGPVSVAVLIHAAVLLAVVTVSLLTLRPVVGPEPRPQWIVPVLPPDLEPFLAGGGAAPRPAERPRENPAPAPPTPQVPPELEPVAPTTTPDDIPIASNDLSLDDGQGAGGDGPGGNGTGPGSGPGLGSGDGPGGPGDGIDDGHGTDPIPLGPGVSAPRLLVKVQPDYPTIARRSRVEGEVVLRAVIGPDGTVTRVEVVRSSSAMFNQAALDAVRQWRYTPPHQEGRAVSVWIDVLVKFNLR